ncbi:hypothetical protein FRB99_000740, partial [Tulasnella sp. 403]
DHGPDGQAPQSGPGLMFDYKWNSMADPSTGVNIKVGTTNGFYVANSFHDLLYKYSFTKAAYNFQNVNFGKGGKDKDAVYMSIQTPGGMNNAGFFTPPE